MNMQSISQSTVSFGRKASPRFGETIEGNRKKIYDYCDENLEWAMETLDKYQARGSDSSDCANVARTIFSTMARLVGPMPATEKEPTVIKNPLSNF